MSLVLENLITKSHDVKPVSNKCPYSFNEKPIKIDKRAQWTKKQKNNSDAFDTFRTAIRPVYDQWSL